MVWNQPKWFEKRDRNLEICLLIECGCSQMGVSRKFGISRQRVHQIWRLYLRHKDQYRVSVSGQHQAIQSPFLSSAPSVSFGQEQPPRLRRSVVSKAQLPTETYHDPRLATGTQDLSSVAPPQ